MPEEVKDYCVFNGIKIENFVAFDIKRMSAPEVELLIKIKLRRFEYVIIECMLGKSYFPIIQSIKSLKDLKNIEEEVKEEIGIKSIINEAVINRWIIRRSPHLS